MKERVAVDTITGYFYQFDFYILKLLEEENQNCKIYIEGIEDVDIKNMDKTIAIQCKYYDKTEYNHSVIKNAIIFMLKHYKNNFDKNLNYYIYGHYKSGQNKLPDNISVEFLKDNFLTYIKDGIKHEVYNELNMEDVQLQEFLKHLKININALEYEEQNKLILNKIQENFSCTKEESNYFYNNALAIVKTLSTNQSVKDRKITPEDFKTKMKTNINILFNIWFIKQKGIDNYCRLVRKKYFTHTNISPYERFFLINCDDTITDIEIKNLIYEISKKWTNISKRNSTPYCPYILLNCISEERIRKIKNKIQEEENIFIDGYNFKNSDFNVKSICKQSNNDNQIKFKFINSIEELNLILKNISKPKEIYQFYTEEIFYENKDEKNEKILIDKTSDIIKII